MFEISSFGFWVCHLEFMFGFGIFKFSISGLRFYFWDLEFGFWNFGVWDFKISVFFLGFGISVWVLEFFVFGTSG